MSRACTDHSAQACSSIPDTSSVRTASECSWNLAHNALSMELIRQAGNEPPLIGLMRVYKDYYPDVIVGDTSGRASVFTHPNQEWRERLQVIQVTSSQRAQDGLSGEKQAFRVARKSASGTRRTRSSVLPEVHTSHAQEVSVPPNLFGQTKLNK